MIWSRGWLTDSAGHAQTVERTDGLAGLVLLDRLDLEAIFLYEKHPAEFHRLRDVLGGDAAADLLLHWREYFGMKRADDTDRRILIAEIASLTPAQQRVAARHPGVLPLILADPAGVTQFVERLAGDEKTLADMLAVLCFISLERGSVGPAIRDCERSTTTARSPSRHSAGTGQRGSLLVSLYGPILEVIGNALPLDQSLILLRVNADYIDELLKTHRPETVAGHLRHVAAAGLTEAVGGSPHALRLVVEYGAPGERALRKAGPDAADVVFGDFTDATLRRQAVAALAAHGSMALAMLDKYAPDPDFREILRTHGAGDHPGDRPGRRRAGDGGLPGCQDAGGRSPSHWPWPRYLPPARMARPRSGRSRTKDSNGSHSSIRAQIQFYQFLPLYDVIHLGNVVGRGYSPTTSEMTWALVDGCFVVADVLSLAAIQPEGAVAAEAIRTEVKAAVREGARSAGRELVETGVAARRQGRGRPAEPAWA